MSTATMSGPEVSTPNDLCNGQMKAVKVGENQNVLLIKVQDKYYATTAKCTHLGAPLEKGVLTSDGRLTCPWHGACFDVKTGDIEDAPAMHCLKTFTSRIEGDQVVISVSQEALKEPRPLPIRGSRKRKEITAVIIGNGVGGQSAAESLREYGFNGRVVVVGKEPYLPIDRTKLSKSLDNTAEKIALRKQEFYTEREIELKIGEEVKSVDFDKKVVTLADGNTQDYSYLVISPGSTPRKLDLPGANLKNVHVLRSLTDNNDLQKALTAFPKPNVVIIGTGWIGMELGSVMAKDGKAKVTIVDKGDIPLKPVLGYDIGKFIKRWHEANGIKFISNTGPKKFVASEDDPAKVGSVLLDNGQTVSADVVLVAIGAGPATEWLKPSPLLNDDGSITVNKYLQVESRKEVFVAGDVAKFPVSDSRNVRVEHYNVGRNTGREIGRNISIAAAAAEKDSTKAPKFTPFTKVPYFWSVQWGKSIRYAGSGPYDEVYIEGDLTSKKGEDTSFAAYYAQNGKVVAVASLNKDPVVSQFSELARLGRCPSLAEIKAGKDILTVPIGPASESCGNPNL
ncbi:hypothetical protein PhCBS80983_g02086 [Powellomyces hirtus]|uniref:Rieske domain-containing protein n=1 Tax=Powellomyces hirtus TaxID=109895 RepID=A0A507E7L3_9FUNG|nr:hypothetical protein PhCBS80983_g02086 [Powellomyces hirtus]